MIRRLPNSFTGPRAYFTDFDHRIVSRTSNLDKLRVKGERKLKALLLLKGKIVCAASHLASQFSYNFFSEHPEILRSAAIVPAFRSDKSDLEELFERKRFKGKQSAIAFYKEQISETVDWELDENSMWFRDRFLADLEDENSLINRNIGQGFKHILNDLTNEIKNGALLARELIDRIAKNLPPKEKRFLKNYRELLYHMSGARVVNCESALPQENYIDYDLADLSQKRTRLSEDQVFSKLFMELVFDSLQKQFLSFEMLDLLSFKDIMEIRKPLLNSVFQKKYDQLVRMAVYSHSESPDKPLDIESLYRIRQDLSDSFESVLQEELPKYLMKAALNQAKQLFSNSSSVALGVAGFVPVYGMIASAISVMKDTPALLVNIGETYSSAKSIKNIHEYQTMREKAIRRKIEHSDIDDKTAFFDMVEILSSTIANRLRI